MTFHEGFLRTDDHDELPSQSYLSLFVSGDHGIPRHSSGPTIASIKCEGEAPLPPPTPIDRSNHPPLPELRLDTVCVSPTPSLSPLALVSDFLDTLAGLVHSPSTPSSSQPSKTLDAIMIFDSQCFVDVVLDQESGTVGDPDTPGYAWATPTIDWEYLSPFPCSRKGADEPFEHLDALLAVDHLERDPDLIDARSSLLC